jgi:phosphatidylglycerophosphate synthase
MSAKSGAANLITGVRILCSFALLFCQPFSLSFIVFYLVAGFTDMIDGAVARKTGTTSEFGAKLDTVADFVFVAVCLWKLLPSLSVPLWFVNRKRTCFCKSFFNDGFPCGHMMCALHMMPLHE